MDTSQLTLVNTKLLLKTDSEATRTYIMWTLVDRLFCNATVTGFKRPRTILALLLIVLAFLVSVKQ